MALIRLLSLMSLDQEFALAVEDPSGLHPAVHDSKGKPYPGQGNIFTMRTFKPGILQRYLYREVRRITTKKIDGAETLTIILY